MRTKIGFGLLAGVVALVAVVSTASAQTLDKWAWVCHARGNGEVVLLAVGARAAAHHLTHGDDTVVPYDPFNPPQCVPAQ